MQDRHALTNKTVVVVRSSYTPYGGVERVALSVIRGLLKKGTGVTLLTLPGQRWPISDPRLATVPLGIGRGTRLLKAWSFNTAVCRYLEARRDETILSFDRVAAFSHLHAGAGTHKTFLKLKRRYSGSVSNLFRRISPFHLYLLHLEKIGFQNPRLVKVRCNSQLVRTDIRQEYRVPPNKLIVIHSGIRWRAMGEAFTGREKIARELAGAHGLDPRWKRLLFLGSGFDRKGLDVALRGMAVIPADYHLIVVGKGASRPYRNLALSLGVADRVRFLGPQADGWRYAALCKALVLPSQYDPFGGAAAEGHAMGLPVLVSDKTGYADMVLHGQNGVILRTPMNDRNLEDAFTGLVSLIENPRWTPDQLRAHSRQVDDDVVMERLLDEFIG
jgi:UDP-glucose:(heptosyl)LPS alpha-1,3-glucosyltransferase